MNVKINEHSNSGCAHIHQTSRKVSTNVVCQKADDNSLLGQDRRADGGIHTTRGHNTSDAYFETLKEPCTAFQYIRRGMLTSGIVLLHDDVRPHTSRAARTRPQLEPYSWELFDHSPYSPELAEIDYLLFIYLKSCLGPQRFNSNGELMESVKMWLSSHRRQTSLTQAYKNLFPDKTTASVPAVTALRSSLSMYVFFVYNKRYCSHCFFC
jgi:hypothetical protein